MKNLRKRNLWTGTVLLGLFAMWTVLVQTVDVRPVGQMGTEVGFAVLNGWFHEFTGVHMWLYIVTDWLGLIPVFVCMGFGAMGLAQLVKRRSLMQVDLDIILLGVYDVLVIMAYLVFEMLPINYRPILIEGRLEASYPSSTTLLVLSVMPTLVFQSQRRMKNENAKKRIRIAAGAFSFLMVAGRLISGVHWLTDIIGSILLSMGLFCMYRALVMRCLAKSDGEE